jgi:predicted Zn-dependent peptidase
VTSRHKKEIDKMETFIASNGLRVVLAPSPTNTVYLGIAIAAGTRNEEESESGMAHFAEHLSFKGTERRTSRQIISRMESVGGDLNALLVRRRRCIIVRARGSILPELWTCCLM